MRDLYADELKAVHGGARMADTSIMPREGPLSPNPAHLTPRQRQCLAWVAAGKSSAEIGAILSLSPHSVDTYLQSACKRLSVRTRLEASRAAQGSLPPNPSQSGDAQLTGRKSENALSEKVNI